MNSRKTNLTTSHATSLYVQAAGLALLIASALFALPIQARAQTNNSETKLAQLQTPRLVRPGDMGTGSLLLKTDEDGKYLEAPRLATDVEIDISGPIARARITQRFTNPSNGWVEGIYVFPLPDGAAVDTLRMKIGDRLIEGKIKEKQEARRIYEEAKADGKKASLVEQERPNMFTNSVANIGPGETIIIQIEYQEALEPDNNIFSLRYPMVVAPRYNPAPAVQVVNYGDNGWAVSDPVPDRERITPPVLDPAQNAPINPVSLTINLDAGFVLGDIKSAYHKITISREGEQTARLSLADGDVPADRDFELTWSPKAGPAPQAALFRETMGVEDYVLMMLTPPATELLQTTSIGPREVIFVLDVSGSMSGESIVQAKASLDKAIARLTPKDRFNVIWFNNFYGKFFSSARRADAENIAEARRLTNMLEANGGTEMLGALKTALAGKAPQGYLRQVIFLTDGAVGNEAQLFAEIDASLGKSRLFTVGIGSAPNSFFMSRAAEEGRGTFTHIGDLSEVGPKMEALFAKLEKPVLTDLAVVWPDGTTVEAWPTPLPDLYAGEPVVLSAKAGSLSGTLRIEGLLAGKPWTASLSLDGGGDRNGVARIWARAKIRSLEQNKYRLGGESRSNEDWQTAEKRLEEEILQTALDYHLVSRLTSLVAVDVTQSRPDGESLTSSEMPTNLPKGWDFDKVFGDQPAQPAPAKMRKASLQMLQIASTPALAEAEAEPKVTLPQTALGIDGMVLTGLAGLLLALGLWFAALRMEQRA